MHFGKKSAFLWFPAEALVVSVLLCATVSIVVVVVIVVVQKLTRSFSALDLVSYSGSWKKP